VTGQGSTNLVYTILGFKPSLLSGFIIVGEVHIIWYQSFGSKASLTIFYFRFLFLFPVPCCEQKKEKKEKKKKKRKEKKAKKKKKKKEKVHDSSQKISSFQSCFSPYSSS
jgi:hypothetical protein